MEKLVDINFLFNMQLHEKAIENVLYRQINLLITLLNGNTLDSINTVLQPELLRCYVFFRLLNS